MSGASFGKINSALFKMGQNVCTATAMAKVPADEILKAMTRHSQGDWGELSEDDKQANQDALKMGDRILSSYLTANGTKFWVITEWDRSVTTVLLPEDY
jgi:hypothetical protein